MNNRFYLAFGVITAAFSCLEADVRELLSGIAFGSNHVIASAFMDSSQLGGNINVLKKLARQYWDKEELFSDIIKSVESIRYTRNLFIHGNWMPNNFGEPNGYAIVVDLKTKYQEFEKSKNWSHGQNFKYNIEDFQNIFTLINTVINKIKNLCILLEEENDDIHFSMIGSTISFSPFEVDIDIIMNNCK